jgi:hypothetical protein
MDTYFRITSYTLVATAVLALALTGELEMWSIALFALAFVASITREVRLRQSSRAGVDVLLRGARRARARRWLWRLLIVLYIPFLFADAFMFSNRILALTHLTLFASAAKLLQRKRDRDWVFLYLLAFFQMLLAAGLTFNATFVASLTAFVFFFISTLASFEIRRARREVSALGEEIIAPIKPPKRKQSREPEAATPASGGRRRVRYLIGASAAQVMIVGMLTLPFFFMIPRFGGGGVSRGLNTSQATGFSDHIELGQVARIKKSQQIVMRVQLDRLPGRYLRWRGIVLETYDGHSWSLAQSVSPGERNQPQEQGRRSVGAEAENDAGFDRNYLLPDQPVQPRSLIEQTITLEPLDTPTLFAAQRPLRVHGPIPQLIRDKYTDALSSSRLKVRTKYSVQSDIGTPSEQELRADSLSSASSATREYIARHYLQLPRNLDPRIIQLAREKAHNAPTPYDKAKAIEEFLKTSFGYTLNLKISGNDPLAEFLFEAREGHCEYFATAMVIMLRALRIPARIVNGFQMGEYNDINRLLVVRESDAHSWVEVYFPTADAWVEFDPTPSAGINDYSQGGLLARLRQYMDAMEVFWLDYIVTLDHDEQASIISSIQQKLVAVKDKLIVYYEDAKQWTRKALAFVIERDWSLSDWLKLGGTLLVLMTAAAAFFVMKQMKQWSLAPTGYGPWWHRVFILPRWKSRRLTQRDRRESAVMFYEQMLAIAARGGLLKSAEQTPLEFAAVSGMDEISEITVLYNRVRFGGAALDADETRRVSRLLAELKRHVRRK